MKTALLQIISYTTIRRCIDTWHSIVWSLQLHHLEGTQSKYLHQAQYLFKFMCWRRATTLPATLHEEENYDKISPKDGTDIEQKEEHGLTEG